MPRFIVFCLALLCLAAGPLCVISSPSLAQGADETSAPRSAWPSAAPADTRTDEKPRSAWGARPDARQSAPERSGGWWQYILTVQQDLYRKLTSAVTALKRGDVLNEGAILIGLSFLYGVFHAAGPGHGKAVITSYVVANGATVRRGIVLSFLAALMQAVTAVAIMGVVAILLNAGGIEIKALLRQFETASGILITLTGCWLLFAYLRRRIAAPVLAPAHAHAGHSHDHHHHDENCGCGHAHMPDPADLKGDWSLTNAAAIIFSIGIRPCSGAIIVLGVAIAQGIFGAGVVATFAMAIGTALTVSALAVLAVGSRDVALRFAGSRWTAGIYDVAAIGGSLLVILLGAGLFWSSLGPASPF